MSQTLNQQSGTAGQSNLTKPKTTKECRICQERGFPNELMGFINDVSQPKGYRVVNPDGTVHQHKGEQKTQQASGEQGGFKSGYNKAFYVLEDEKTIVETISILNGGASYSSPNVKELLEQGWKPAGTSTGEHFREYYFNAVENTVVVVYKLVKRKKVEFGQ